MGVISMIGKCPVESPVQGAKAIEKDFSTCGFPFKLVSER